MNCFTITINILPVPDISNVISTITPYNSENLLSQKEGQ